MNLLNLTITTAITATVTPAAQMMVSPRNLTVQANFTYGSGGTTADAYLQTSLDGGVTWCDIAQFHFTTASLRKVFNLNAQTPVTTQATPSDGSLAANTSVDGILGRLFRVKYVTTGTYAGVTTLSIDIATDQVTN
jgi:hypothetical protein